MERLLDRTRLRAAQQLRYKVELMFRSSTINEDRSQVMLYNDPIPNVNNREGEEGVARYMPSWMNEQWVSHLNKAQLQNSQWSYPWFIS